MCVRLPKGGLVAALPLGDLSRVLGAAENATFWRPMPSRCSVARRPPRTLSPLTEQKEPSEDGCPQTMKGGPGVPQGAHLLTRALCLEH